MDITTASARPFREILDAVDDALDAAGTFNIKTTDYTPRSTGKEAMKALVTSEGIEQSSFSLLTIGSAERTLLTFIELEGYPILRITENGLSKDHVLNSDQVKLLLRQMTLWLTR